MSARGRELAEKLRELVDLTADIGATSAELFDALAEKLSADATDDTFDLHAALVARRAATTMRLVASLPDEHPRLDDVDVDVDVPSAPSSSSRRLSS